MKDKRILKESEKILGCGSLETPCSLQCPNLGYDKEIKKCLRHPKAITHTKFFLTTPHKFLQ